MGGIAGNSSGVISSCTNYGTIGYNHTGYNVGGIAGSQNGKILNFVPTKAIYTAEKMSAVLSDRQSLI